MSKVNSGTEHSAGERAESPLTALADRLTRKMSDRQRLLLRLIAANCVNGTDGRFWIPRATEQFFQDALGCEGVWVSGSGDAAILRGFSKKGLTEPRELTPYACKITELGRCAVAKIIATHNVPAPTGI